MIRLQEHWKGASIAGCYTLENWLGGDENTAVFQTSLPADGRRAIVKLVTQAACDGTAILDRWQRIRQLRHPNLIGLLDCGRAEHRSEAAFYAVFEWADETLADALERSPLNAQESREVLEIVLDTVQYVHSQGLVLGALDTRCIVAVDDRIKISTDRIRKAEALSTYSEDVRLLGELWRQVLMPASPRSAEIAAHATDPNPQTRWTLAEIEAALNPPARTTPAPPPRSDQNAPQNAPVFRFPTWTVVSIGMFVLLVYAVNRPRTADVAAESRAIPVPAAAEAPAPPVSAPKKPAAAKVEPAVRETKPETRPAPKPPQPTPSPAAPIQPASIQSAPGAGEEAWQVIAFTFHTRAAAEKKAEQLNEYHPGLNAAVLSPKGQQGNYMVSIGGRMTHEDAVRLQHSAQGRGIPRDLRVQSYPE
jgi:hypothetical protein